MKGKTNAQRMLDSAKIPYEVREYEVDEDNLADIEEAISDDLCVDAE